MIRILPFLLAIAIFWSSCNILNETPPAVISTVKSTIRVDLYNPLTHPSPVGLWLSTIDEVCDESYMVAYSHLGENTLNVHVEGLIGPPECLSGNEIITKSLPMNPDPGTYSVSMFVGESLKSSGVLNFDGEEYRLSFDQTEGFTIGHASLRLIPESTIWGSVRGDEAAEALDDLVSRLGDISSKPHLEPGYYGHFTVTGPAQFELVSITGESVPALTFVLSLDGSFDELRNVLQETRAKFGEKAEISCFAWNGETF